MTDKKQEHQQDPATGKGKAKKKHFRRIKPGNMYFRWKDTQSELPKDYYQKALKEYASVYRRPKDPKDEVIKGLEAHVRELKQTVATLENKLHIYEKGNIDSQSGNEQPADH
jgi:hypothetical protein